MHFNLKKCLGVGLILGEKCREYDTKRRNASLIINKSSHVCQYHNRVKIHDQHINQHLNTTRYQKLAETRINGFRERCELL